MVYNIFTVSRSDVYDYLRCPKIVSIKTYRNLTKPKPVPKTKEERNLRYEIGTIGEVATQSVLSGKGVFVEGEPSIDKIGEVSLEEGEEYEEALDIHGEEMFADEKPAEIITPQTIRLNLEQKGVQLDTQMTQILKDTIDGLVSIKKYLEDEYGEIKIVGRAESRNGLMPNKIRPDFVAISTDNKKPILIEVKNSAYVNERADHFQAAFYNSTVRNHGVIVLEERVEANSRTIVPKSIEDPISDTLLIYPRHGKYEKISDTIRLETDIVKEIWMAKQLGLLGKSPETDCGSSCPHHRYEELPEENMETAVPLPLIYAKGLVEQDVDLDLNYLRSYLYRKGIGSVISNSLFELGYAEFLLQHRMRNADLIENEKRLIHNDKEKLLDIVSQKTGISRDLISKMMSDAASRTMWEGIGKIEKEMVNEIQPWKKILGNKRFETLKNSIKIHSSKLYPLPENSASFVKKSWNQWD